MKNISATNLCVNDGVSAKSFIGASGKAEHILIIEAPGGSNFSEQVASIQSRYSFATQSLGIKPESAIFRRIFLSDIINQAPMLEGSDLLGSEENLVAVSIVQQPPLSGAKIAMLAYHIADKKPIAKHRLSPNHIIFGENGRRHLWTTGLCTASNTGNGNAYEQTNEIFNDLIAILASQGATLAENCVRTWIYLKDVDVFYQGMVDSRRELFAKHGLTADTHYIASTGIQGACAHQFDLVYMDALSVLDVAPEQISYLNDFDMLCPTYDYNVTFERGTRVAYADRAHHYISGTASIDNAGNVLFPGDVIKQLYRAMENVDALLRSGGASLDDMMYLIVYLRDPSDYKNINTIMRNQYSYLPAIIVQGAVCRPGWLVEVEGVAAAKYSDSSIAKFLGE